ncbi:MFS transporter [Dictyobacter aurantiacus]|uniref:MFS transporter n=1 Tax=Dictyobacter aurantiacus TaxID=1936993 RepID=A0A401ZD34_9CHLR|nr:MFS transporter [Dictyobacter aurantiacus]GCE04598.1 MFS transporter [Dictyobacter aurantiacus]
MNTLVRSLAGEGEKEGIEKAIALITICLGYFMVILDTTIVNVALPSIQHELNATVTGLQWAVAGYNLVFASLLLTAGALGDRVGSKKVFLWGLVLFALASCACGAAPSLWILQGARVLQGAGAALLVPNSLALLNHTFSTQRERARAIGFWGSIGGIGAICGPVLGGLLIHVLNWRYIFWVNVPVAAVALLLTLRYVVSAPRQARRELDLGAQFTGIIALAALTLVFIQGNAWGWFSWPILLSGAAFVFFLVCFLIIERRAASPMLPLELFSVPTFSAANMVGFLINLGFYGQMFVISFYFQQARGYSPLLTGFALLPETGVVLIASLLSGRVSGRVGPYWPMVIGQATGCIGLLMLVMVQPSTSYLILSIMLLAIGFGMAFTMPAMTTAVIESAPNKRAGIASAVLNAGRQMGSVLGVAILGSLVGARTISIPGVHISMLLAGAAFFGGCLLTLFFVDRKHV